MTHDQNTTQQHPHLYTSTFIEEFFRLPLTAVAGALHNRTLNTYGTVSAKGLKPGQGISTHVVTAADVSLWLQRRRTKATICISPDRLDAMLQAELVRCPPEPRTLQHTLMHHPDSLRWLSDYVHHGGRTRQPQENANGIQETSRE